MKKKTYMFLCMVFLALAGCGKPQKNENPQENENSVSENISEETEHKDTQSAGQNEQQTGQQTGQAADSGAYPPCVRLTGYSIKIRDMLLPCPDAEQWTEKLCRQWQELSCRQKMNSQISGQDIRTREVRKVTL